LEVNFIIGFFSNYFKNYFKGLLRNFPIPKVLNYSIGVRKGLGPGFGVLGKEDFGQENYSC